MSTFRLIQSGPCDAATNMAVDEAIFLCYRENDSWPTLRLYGWSPASYSIGISQNPETLCLNTSFVRRPTGGGALFHDNELTYSFVASGLDIGLSSGVKESYAKITSFLIKAYEILDQKAIFAKDIATEGPINNHIIEPFCQFRKEEYDIVVNGKKMGGNAQKRRRNIFLQHGSIPWITDKGNLLKAVLTAFSAHFNTRLIPGELTSEERACVQNLKNEKYENAEWNQFGKTNGAAARVA